MKQEKLLNKPNVTVTLLDGPPVPNRRKGYKMFTKFDLIERILKGRERLADPTRTGNDRKAVKGNLRDWFAQLRDGRFVPEEDPVFAVWVRESYFVQAVRFDYDLQKFEVRSFEDELLGCIYPGTLDDQVIIAGDLDSGADVHGWADGQGGEIVIPGR